MATHRDFKREFTTNGGGLMTPTSFASASEDRSTVTPKRDESVSWSSINSFQEPRLTHDLLNSCDGLPVQDRQTHHDQNDADSNSSRTLPGEGLKVLGHDVNRLVSLIDKLRRIGLKSVEGTLPELVLVGDQSVCW